MKLKVFNKTIPIEPLPAPNPLSKVSLMEYRHLIQSYFPSVSKYPLKENRFAVKLLFSINGRKSKQHPKTDLDNLIKPILDAGKGYFWDDDSQVDEIKAKIRRHCNKSSLKITVLAEVERLKGK